MKITAPSTALIAMALAAHLKQASAQQCIPSTLHTFYGYPTNNNTNKIAYNCGRGLIAQGTGTFAYPLTFASADGAFDQCEIIYSPYLKKYLIHEDICLQCTVDWDDGNGERHIDVWDMACENGGEDEEKCENALMPNVQGKEVIRFPSAFMDVEEGALYELGGSPSCRTDRVFPDSA